MRVIKSIFNGVLVLKSKKYNDERGSFSESFVSKSFIKHVKKDIVFCQDNITYSKKNVIRGLHYQISPYSQSKLVSVLKGKILDCVIDLRKNSKTFGKVFKIILSDKNCLSLFIPKGFAHAYFSYEKTNIVYYKLTNYYKPSFESGINLLDKKLKIKWPKKKVMISKKDKKLISFKEFIDLYKFL